MSRIALWLMLLALASVPPAARAFVFCDSAENMEAFDRAWQPLRNAFREKRFDEIDRNFNSLLAGHESGKLTDAEVNRWFRTVFENSNTEREPLHLDWIAKYPGSPAALLAAAHHYVARGFDARGGDFANKTSNTQFEAMAYAFNKALFLLDKVDSLMSKRSLSLAHRISIVTASGLPRDTTAQGIYRKALEAYPDTLQVRIRYIWASNPKWGGSMAQLAAIADETKGLNADDRRYIQYLVYTEMGSAYETVEDLRKAGEAYERAVPLCPGFTDALDSAIRTYRVSKNFEGLISATTRFIERKPRAGPAYGTRGWAYYETGRLRESFSDYQKAADLGYGPGYEGLAWHYESGKVVPQDYKRAIELYLTAADRGQKTARAKAERISKATGIPMR